MTTTKLALDTYYATPDAAIADLRTMSDDIAANAHAISDPEMQVWSDNLSQIAHDFSVHAHRATAAPALVEALREIRNQTDKDLVQRPDIARDRAYSLAQAALRSAGIE